MSSPFTAVENHDWTHYDIFADEAMRAVAERTIGAWGGTATVEETMVPLIADRDVSRGLMNAQSQLTAAPDWNSIFYAPTHMPLDFGGGECPTPADAIYDPGDPGAFTEPFRSHYKQPYIPFFQCTSVDPSADLETRLLRAGDIMGEWLLDNLRAEVSRWRFYASVAEAVTSNYPYTTDRLMYFLLGDPPSPHLLKRFRVYISPTHDAEPEFTAWTLHLDSGWTLERTLPLNLPGSEENWNWYACMTVEYDFTNANP